MQNNPLQRQLIIDNYKNPYNCKIPKNYYSTASSENRSCGDEIQIYLKTDAKNKTVLGIYFTANACALTVASASLIAQELEGQNVKKLKEYSLQDAERLIGADLSQNRKNCVQIVVDALHLAVEHLD